MYKLLLCWRYLLTRYLALVCIVSVLLGVATLIVVNSVMAGFSSKLRDRLQSGVVAIGGEKDGKALILVAATKDVIARGIRADDLIREISKQVGGSGGGKPEMAQAGGADPARIAEALQSVYDLVVKGCAEQRPQP